MSGAYKYSPWGNCGKCPFPLQMDNYPIPAWGSFGLGGGNCRFDHLLSVEVQAIPLPVVPLVTT